MNDDEKLKEATSAGGQNDRIAMCVDSCFDCANFHLCYMRRGMEDQIRAGINLLNIDGDARPGRYADIYQALGSACIEFNQSST